MQFVGHLGVKGQWRDCTGLRVEGLNERWDRFIETSMKMRHRQASPEGTSRARAEQGSARDPRKVMYAWAYRGTSLIRNCAPP